MNNLLYFWLNSPGRQLRSAIAEVKLLEFDGFAFAAPRTNASEQSANGKFYTNLFQEFVKHVRLQLTNETDAMSCRVDAYH